MNKKKLAEDFSGICCSILPKDQKVLKQFSNK